MKFRRIFCLVSVLFILVFLFTSSGCAETHELTIDDKKAIGVIRRSSDRKTIGSAFVAGNQKHLITCAHVAASEGYVFRGVDIPKDISIESKFFLPKFDLSVFTLKDSIEIKPLAFGDCKSIRPGDTIIYIGWDKSASIINISKAKVIATGSYFNRGTIIDFLEFYGHGLPGYSGGPVLNSDGKVVAIMREAWTKKGIKGGKRILVNRAFSTDILAVFDKEIFKRGDSEMSLNSNKVFGLINIQKKYPD